MISGENVTRLTAVQVLKYRYFQPMISFVWFQDITDLP